MSEILGPPESAPLYESVNTSREAVHSSLGPFPLMKEDVMSQLVVLIGSVPATSNAQTVFAELTSGTPSIGLAFKNTILGSVLWGAPESDSGWNWGVSPSGGAAFLAVESAAGQVAGSMTMNFAMDVDVSLVLTGRNGALGKQTLPAGQTSASFTFTVGPNEGLNQYEVATMINEFLNSQS